MSDTVFLVLNLVGALAFGLVVGWVTSSVFRRAKRNAITDISAVIGAVAGATVVALFSKEGGAFATYCIGLAIGFFYYIYRATKKGAPQWLGNQSFADDGGSDPLPPSRSDPLPPAR
jgi:NhaP-type Na+/H+ or K+/H+ antiporter